jgi:hypothetical protein
VVTGTAKASKVPAVTIGEFETGKTDPKMSTVQKLRRAMEKAGVDFLDATPEAGPGVRLRDGVQAIAAASPAGARPPL